LPEYAADTLARQQEASVEIPAGVETLCDLVPWQYPSLARSLYMPFGSVLAFLRLLSIPLFCGFGMVLPRQHRHVVFNAMLAVMGLRIRYNVSRAEIRRRVAGCVVAANHISLIDNFLVTSLPCTTIMVGDPMRKANPLSVAIGYLAFRGAGAEYWTIRNRRNLVSHLADWRKDPSSTALYVTPEGTIDNGKGLFRFEPELLTRDMPVVPLALKLIAPFGLNAHPLFDPGWRNLLRLLSMPWLRFELTYLPARMQAPGQSTAAFAKDVQTAIADHLGIVATGVGRADKHDYRRRMRPGALKVMP